ncbi:DUF805 domain-containing protein [Flavobacterium sp. 3HN19-14]|uniref:DUF805 domain-containing protein n=1 Tax=Flavobacterium sp. 3HN19-14 TaxID=3448133 RepID=UPI003EDFBDBE
MIEYYKLAISNYANFSGRARRSEYWYFVLANILICIVLFGLMFAVGGGIKSVGAGLIFLILYVVYALFVFIPSLSVLVRRLHDVGKSGWYYFIQLIPVIGGIWLLFLLFSEGDYQEVEEIGVPEA